MKKLLLLVALATFSFGAFAQFQMGLKFGLNITKNKATYSTGTVAEAQADAVNDMVKSKMGMGFGLVMNTGGNIFSFQPEIMYMQRGSKYEFNGEDAGSFSMSYIDLKPMFNFGYGNDDWKAYAQFGPSFNYWLSKKLYDKDGKFIEKSDEWSDDDEAVNGSTDIRFDFGWVMGAGFKYKLGPGWALINPRYEWGLIPHTIDDTGSDGYGLVNKGFSINLGYLYEF